jgi:hypothetical protein
MVARQFRNPGLWVILAGIALVLDMTLRTDYLAPGTMLRGLSEPGRQFVRYSEGWFGLIFVFAGMWYFNVRSKTKPPD